MRNIPSLQRVGIWADDDFGYSKPDDNQKLNLAWHKLPHCAISKYVLILELE
jgi:hypothetical protein